MTLFSEVHVELAVLYGMQFDVSELAIEPKDQEHVIGRCSVDPNAATADISVGTDELADFVARGAGFECVEVLPTKGREFGEVDLGCALRVYRLANALTDRPGAIARLGAADQESRNEQMRKQRESHV